MRDTQGCDWSQPGHLHKENMQPKNLCVRKVQNQQESFFPHRKKTTYRIYTKVSSCPKNNLQKLFTRKCLPTKKQPTESTRNCLPTKKKTNRIYMKCLLPKKITYRIYTIVSSHNNKNYRKCLPPKTTYRIYTKLSFHKKNNQQNLHESVFPPKNNLQNLHVHESVFPSKKNQQNLHGVSSHPK